MLLLQQRRELSLGRTRSFGGGLHCGARRIGGCLSCGARFGRGGLKSRDGNDAGLVSSARSALICLAARSGVRGGVVRNLDIAAGL